MHRSFSKYKAIVDLVFMYICACIRRLEASPSMDFFQDDIHTETCRLNRNKIHSSPQI
jgi:hypothetical protein